MPKCSIRSIWSQPIEKQGTAILTELQHISDLKLKNDSQAA
jgi:hypothetical protein